MIIIVKLLEGFTFFAFHLISKNPFVMLKYELKVFV